MRVLIETIESAEQERAAMRVRDEVFGREWKCRVARPDEGLNAAALHLLARAEPGGDPIAALSVVETTNMPELHARFNLEFEEGARAARYTQLAVAKPYRGLHVSLALMLEARWRFVLPHGFDYTWLLLDAGRARNSPLCRSLGFEASAGVFHTEHGRVRALRRAEKQSRAAGLDHITAHALAGLRQVA